MSKGRKRALTALAAAIALALGLCLAGCAYFTSERAYELNWNIDLPRSLTELYSADSGASFTGDGYEYNVYAYGGGDTAFEALFFAGPDALAERSV